MPSEQVPGRISELRDAGVEEVVVQRFIQPTLSGIAFVRHLAVELEWVEGHLESLADGQVSPQRAILSRLGAAWESGHFATTRGLSASALWDFLQGVLKTFHYVPGDVEWAWDGQQLWLLQYRPISDYGWRRHLTAANIAEILPPQPSRFVEYGQRRAAASIPAIMARWDARVLQDNEPFTAVCSAVLPISTMICSWRGWPTGACPPPAMPARWAAPPRSCPCGPCACCARCHGSCACSTSPAATY